MRSRHMHHLAGPGAGGGHFLIFARGPSVSTSTGCPTISAFSSREIRFCSSLSRSNRSWMTSWGTN